MTKSVHIAFLCPDRVGLISAVTARLFDLGGDLGDTSFSILGEAADFTTVCDFPDDVDLETITQELRALPELEKADSLTVEPFQHPPLKGPAGNVTHQLSLSGGNRPGLVARLSEALIDYQANVVRLTTEVVRAGSVDDYVILMAVSIPADKTYTCLATIDNLAQQLALTLRVETV